MKHTISVLILGVGALSLCASVAVDAATCESLARLTLDNAKVTVAQDVAAGAFTPPGPARQGGAAPQQPRAFAALPAFCRVAATLTPSSDSDIKIEVWLPAKWNGKFQAVGNGGWAGTISYTALATAVAAGYATASTDTGHVGGTGAFALGHPEKVIDFGYRSVHEMTRESQGGDRRLLRQRGRRSRSGTAARRADGRASPKPSAIRPTSTAIVAGAPAVNWLHLHSGRLAINRTVNATPASVIPPAKYPGHSSGRARGVRRARRCGRRRDRESRRLHLRSEGAAVFRRRTTPRVSRRRRSSRRGRCTRAHPIP